MYHLGQKAAKLFKLPLKRCGLWNGFRHGISAEIQHHSIAGFKVYFNKASLQAVLPNAMQTVSPTQCINLLNIWLRYIIVYQSGSEGTAFYAEPAQLGGNLILPMAVRGPVPTTTVRALPAVTAVP